MIANEGQKSLLPPLIPYTATTQDAQNRDYISPFATQSVSSIYYRHWLGTDILGRDVLAGLITGTRHSIWIGLCGMAIALAIGLVLGLTAGYYGDQQYQRTIIGFILRGVLLIGIIFYTILFIQLKLSILILFFIAIFILFIINFLEKIFLKIPIASKKINIPLDMLIMRFVEVIQAVPNILWLLGLISITRSLTIGGLILFIGLTNWTSLTRLIRGEVIQVRTNDYIEASKALGLTDWRILLRHILPNIATPIFIAVAFGIANCILFEAFLTFIGIGLPLEQITWGSMLNGAKHNISAWWLAIFSGFMIFLTITTFNRIGESLNKK
jgi:peptide/nickel transport system permease protein